MTRCRQPRTPGVLLAPRPTVSISRQEVTARGLRRHRAAWRFEYHVGGALLPGFSKLAEARAYAKQKHPGARIVLAWKTGGG